MEFGAAMLLAGGALLSLTAWRRRKLLPAGVRSSHHRNGNHFYKPVDGLHFRSRRATGHA